MTEIEWLANCAAQYQKRGGLTPTQAAEAAAVTFDALRDMGDDWQTTDPAQAADDDMDCWTDDEP